jgi:hypothetical protein
LNGQECIEALSKEPLSIDGWYGIRQFHEHLANAIEKRLGSGWNVVTIQEESQTNRAPLPHALGQDPVYLLLEFTARFIVQCAGPNRNMIQLSFRLTSDGKLLLIKDETQYTRECYVRL